MSDLPILSFAIWVPISAGLVVLVLGLIPGMFSNPTIKTVGFFASLISLVSSVLPLLHFQSGFASMQLVERFFWIKSLGISYFLGVDGISIFFIPLTGLVTFIVIVSAWEVVSKKVSLYIGNFLVLSGLLNGVFSALD